MKIKAKRPLRIVFIRHGQSIRNKLCHLPYLSDDEKIIEAIGQISDRDTPLSELGFEQARRTGVALRRMFPVPDIVFHSGYLRTEQTTKELLSSYRKNEIGKIKVIKDDSIRERAVGYVYNMKESDARKFFPWVVDYRRLFSDFDFCPPGGESLVQVVDRVGDFIERIKFIPKVKTIFVVSHGRAIQCAIYYLLNRDFKNAFERKEGPVKNCGVIVFERNDSGIYVLKNYNMLF